MEVMSLSTERCVSNKEGYLQWHELDWPAEQEPPIVSPPTYECGCPELNCYWTAEEEIRLWHDYDLCRKYHVEAADSYARFMVRTFEVATTNVPLVDLIHDKPSQLHRHKMVPAPRKPRPLTPREREVIFCWIFRAELSTKKLPEFLGISKWTYNGYREAIESKLGATSQSHAVTIILAQFIRELQISPY